MRIVLTQADGRLEALARALRDAGHDPVVAPLLRTRPLVDAATRVAAKTLLGMAWRCYASRSAVEAWVALGLPFDDGARLAAVGAGTARDLVEQARAAHGPGLPPPLTPPPEGSSAAGLAAALLRAGAAGQEVGLVQGRRARPELAQRLRAGGAFPRTATVYDVITLPWQVTGRVDAVLLTSPSAAAALPREIGDHAVLIALGPTTAAALRERGWRCREAPEPSTEGVVSALAGLAPLHRDVGARGAP